MRLEEELDREVDQYLKKVEGMEEVQELLSGKIGKDKYKKFLKTFYAIEHLSQRAVNMASINTEKTNLYLSKRFHICAQGELGHAEIALKDLSELGGNCHLLENPEIVKEYDRLLQKEAEVFPLAILGHSYLFENVSGKLFPKHKKLKFPSKFIEVHAKEDPGHSRAIKRTLRNIEKDLSKDNVERIIDFTRQSGEYLMKVFEHY